MFEKPTTNRSYFHLLLLTINDVPIYTQQPKPSREFIREAE